MTEPLPIRRYEIFHWENKDYLCLLTADNIWWVYLPAVFGPRVASLRKKYPTFSFQPKTKFEKFSFSKFSTKSHKGVFLSFAEFKQLLEKEKKESLLGIFEQKLGISSLGQSASSLLIPGYIYLAVFPSLNLGKIGITKNWKKRLVELQREYSADGELVFHAETKDARTLEDTMLDWLKKQNAVVPFTRKKGTQSRETFSLKKISEKKVRDELVLQLSKEKEAELFSFQTMEKVETFLLKKLEADPSFALQFFLERERIFVQETYRALSPEKRDQLATEKLSQFSRSNLFFQKSKDANDNKS